MCMFCDLGYKVGNIGYLVEYVCIFVNKGEVIVILDGCVYDMIRYLKGGCGQRNFFGEFEFIDCEVFEFMYEQVVGLFSGCFGEDVLVFWEGMDFDVGMKSRMCLCFDNFFYVVDVDICSLVQCKFLEYFVLFILILLVFVIVFKFFVVLQFGIKNILENFDKFVMCQILVYIEDEEFFCCVIDLVVCMWYDDKCKLLVIVCDGMIIG